jgi:Ca2+-binding RTX toxin-like protein
VVLYGIDQQTFDAATVSRIVFNGRAGNDWFKNETDLPAEAHGHGGDDTLIGGTADDDLRGGNGNDQLYGNAGNDKLYGHAGLDHVFGQAGDDWIWTGNDDDFADGGAGEDRLFGGTGRDHLRGGLGHDHVSGEDDGDFLFGDDGDDLLLGAGDSDFINAGPGNDDARGGSGNDAILGDSGTDRLVGNAGDDWLSGGSEADILIGSEGHDQLLGGSHDDHLWGESGNDFIRGDDGDDVLGGGSGDDALFGNAGNDALYGEDGHDHLYGHDGHDRLFGNDGDDFLNGNKGDDTIRGQDGADFLRGHSGSDDLDGGSDDDDLAGGGGTDHLKGGLGNDDYIQETDDLVESDAHDYSADGDFELRGEVSGLNTSDKTFELLGLTVSFAGARLKGSFQNGSLVKAEGRFANGLLTAYEVEPLAQVQQDNFEARGIVTDLDPQAQTFRFFGILVDYGSAQVHATLVEGAAVYVEGQLAGLVVNAREIHPATGQHDNNDINRNLELRGEVTQLDPVGQTFQILGVTVDFSGAFLENLFQEGSLIKVDGDFRNNQLTAREIELEMDPNRDENVEAVGVISGLNTNSQTFEILGLIVDYSGADLDGPLSDGISVQVEGWFSNFSIVAERVRPE